MTRRRFSLAMAAALVLGSPAAAAPLDLLYERTVMAAADRRCALFEPNLRAALNAFRAQARAASLRAGATNDEVTATERRAISAATRAKCQSTDIAQAAARVREAFQGYSRMIRMELPGDLASWKADRSSSVEALRWRLSQPSDFGRDHMIFGLAGRQGADVLLALAWFADEAAPYGARLVMRDVEQAPRPYLAGPTLAQRLPSSAVRGVMAEARSPAGRDLRPKEAKGGWAFRFPASAAAAVAELDPREAIAIEYLMPGDRVRRAYIEVGDFAAGRAFLLIR